MIASGFVLAGGRSRRMGRDKALLSYHGQALVAHVAGIVQQALGDAAKVMILGDPERYRALGFPARADVVPGCGPLGGIVTALTVTETDWNLVAACDMPSLEAAGVAKLVECARDSSAVCIAARNPAGELEPLCAVYHRRCLGVLEQALRDQRFKMKDALMELRPESVPLPAAALANVNTPEQWIEFEPK